MIQCQQSYIMEPRRPVGGWARSRTESAHPNLWYELRSFWAPLAGHTGITTLPDYSGRGNNGAWQGMNSGAWVMSPWGPCLQFNGSSNYITLTGATANSLEPTIGLTVHSALLLNGSSLTSRTNIARAQAGGSVSGWGTGVSDSSANRLKFYTATSAGSANNLSATTALVSQAWYTAAWTYFPHASATNKFIYLNGKEDASVAWGSALGYTSCLSSIGRYEGGTSQYWLGNIVTLGVWGRVLSPQERAILDRDPLAPLRPKRTFVGKSVPPPPATDQFSWWAWARRNQRGY